ncbi:acyltransferase [Polynucleobacter sp. AP-Latsch-80-C2]|jgi:peptidoglycan/LPS O-acetylase OafA/YrhL|uniref:acyltransferase family protein n=1 Tax=Polynucleobacter sp. AP-Latsch-80-C2 TaxID=2576931 RepID=UPI001C0D8068|nr:acyltransferase [Polynucleobacter sp. AP-Latsch-80-C2]MBU3623210.1 acyltransferase [Polynucleobacter sp. AP-Latsch-80-C2]
MGLIRFLLAYSVVVGHFTFFPTYKLVGTDTAVEAFFILSGFYIAMIWDTQYNSVKDFWINRFLRLYPAYFVIAAINLVVNLIEPGELKNIFTFPPLLSAYLIFTNATMILQDWAMFLGLQDGHLHFVSNFNNSNPPIWRYLLIPQAWTLGVEISLYILAPLLFIKKFKYVFVVFIASMLIRIYLLMHGKYDDPWGYRFFPSELALFMMGAVAYCFYSKIKFDSNPDLFNLLGKWLTTLIIGFIFFFPNIVAGYEFKKGLFYLLLASATPFIFYYSKSNKWDRFIGELSYPMYLVWALRIDVVGPIVKFFNLTSESAIGVVSYGYIILMSILIHLYVERPFEKIRARFRSKNKQVA